MTTIEEIEEAVAKLPPEALAAFLTWFEASDAQQFDKAIERDAASGMTSSRPQQTGDGEMYSASATGNTRQRHDRANS